MLVQKRIAHPTLRSVVRSYSERRAALGGQVVTAPLPARPDQFMEFYLGDCYQVSQDDGAPEAAPEAVIVGPQSYRRTRLLMSGDIHVFTIGFQPGGFHALFGTQMTHLVDQGAIASDIIGLAAYRLRDAILRERDFAARIIAAERWLAPYVEAARPADDVDGAAAAIVRSGGRLRIDMLARHAMLSDRQFTRRFEAQVGLRPKLFARTVRLNAVLDAKSRSPRASWTELVHRAGYADQSHFIRDCHALAGGAPAEFFAEWVVGR